MRALVPIERGAQIFCCYVDRETAGKTNTQAKEVADIDVLAGGGGGSGGGASSRIHSPLLGDKVDCDIGLSHRPDSLWSLTGRYDNPMP